MDFYVVVAGDRPVRVCTSQEQARAIVTYYRMRDNTAHSYHVKGADENTISDVKEAAQKFFEEAKNL